MSFSLFHETCLKRVIKKFNEKLGLVEKCYFFHIFNALYLCHTNNYFNSISQSSSVKKLFQKSATNLYYKGTVLNHYIQ